jgi:hypothetical protein
VGTPNFLRASDDWTSGYMLLQENLGGGGEARKVVLTGGVDDAVKVHMGAAGQSHGRGNASVATVRRPACGWAPLFGQ